MAIGNKGNVNAKGRAVKHGTTLTARTRACILNAFDVIDNDKSGKRRPMSEVLADAFADNPLKFMDMSAKYIVKDIDKDIDSYKDADKLTDSELADIIAKRARALHEAKTDKQQTG